MANAQYQNVQNIQNMPMSPLHISHCLALKLITLASFSYREFEFGTGRSTPCSALFDPCLPFAGLSHLEFGFEQLQSQVLCHTYCHDGIVTIPLGMP